MATKKFGVQSPFLANRATKDYLTKNSALDSAAMANRNLSEQYLKFKNTRPSQFSGDPYSYGYKKASHFYDSSSTPLSEVSTPDREITYEPVTVNNVAKVGADDITQYLSGAFKSIEPQYGETAPNRQLNRNAFEGYSIRFGKGGAAKKAIAEIEGILSRLPKGSAASNTKVARELEQEAAEKAALYTTAPITNKTGKDAIAQAKKTLSEPKAKKPLTKQQFQNQYVQHIDIRGREGDAEENAKAIMEQGFRRGLNANAYTPFSGLPHRDVVSAKFQPLEGDVVYLAPKGQWVTTPNGVQIKEGWKPQPHEVVRVRDPKKSMYEYYLESQNSDGALKQLEAPTIIIPSKLAEVEKYVRGREGSHGANRVQYAADQIKNLERQYTEQGLKEAFSGDNARALMIGNPADFQKYADRLERPSKGGIAEYKYFMSQEGGGADDVPYLVLDREVGEIPYVAGHEGRHRNLALEELGDDKTLWRMLPRASLREHLPRRSQEEYLDALVKEIGNPAEVSPEERKGVLVRKLPKMFLKGGLAHLAKGGVAHMAEGGQKFPVSNKYDERVYPDIAPLKPKRPIANFAGDVLQGAHDLVSKPFGYENPPMEMFSEFLGVPAIARTLKDYGYGFPLTTGSGQTLKMRPDAEETALTAIPMVGPTAKAVAKVGKKVAKEAVDLAPYAANNFSNSLSNMLEKYNMSGLDPTMNVVKPKGGNWMDMDRTVNALKIRRPADHSPPEKVLRDFDQYWNPSTLKTLTEEGAAGIANRRQAITNQIKVNEWIDKKLGNYIKNEFATPEDSIRLGMERRVEQAKKTKTDNEAKLANMKQAIDKRKAEGKDTTLSERDYEAAKEKADEENLFANKSVSHLSAPEEGWALNLYRDDYYPNQASIDKRIEGGFPEEGLSTNNQAAKLWEDVSDYFVESRLASSVPEDSYILKDNPWIAKVVEKDPNTPLYSVNPVDLNQDLEFRHMIDELQEAMNPASVLPQNLRITEKDLEKMTVDDVSALSGKITAWRAAQKVKVDKDIANNPAMHTFKEYTENNPKGVRWQQIKRPDGYSREEQEKFVREATKYEGDLMRHCVGGVGHCDPLLNNEVEIYSLRDAKGVPHVTIEVDKGANAPSFYERNRELLEYPEIADEHEEINNSADTAAEYIRRVTNLLDEKGYEQGKDYFIPKPKLPEITEIKGKGNQKPNDEYLPFVQDFIRSGQWGAVGDISNTGLRSSRSVLGEGVVKALRDRGEYVPPVMGFDEAVKFQELYNPNAFKDITSVEDYRKTWDRGGVGDGYAEGGLVEDDNNLMSLVDEHFLNQPIAFGIGGIAKKLAGKAAKSLEGQLDDAAEKLLDEHIAKTAKPKAAAKDKFLPVDLPRTTRSKQQIEAHAERVARQMTGEHVRDPKNPKDSSNLAGRSMREVERLKNLEGNYTLEDLKDLPDPQIIEPKVGDVNILTVGDTTVSDKRLVDMNGYPIESTQEGGPFFGQGKLHLPDDQSLWWASEESAAQNYQNRVNEIAERYGMDKLSAHHLAMGQQANNFAMHFADANLKAINTFGVPEEGIGAINSTVRNGFSIIKDGERIDFKFPDFPGVEKIDDAYKYFREKPEARKWFNNRMKTPALTQEYGLPNGLDIQYAITDPLLRNMEINLTGRSVGDVYKGAELTDTAEHGTYGKGIRGKFQGRTKYPIPMELSHSDAYDYTAARKNKAHITGTLQKVAPHQIVDQQYLDEIGYYNDLIKKYTGKRKGGKITAKERVERKMYDIDANEPNRMGLAPYGLRYALTVSEVPQAKGKGYMGEMRGSEGVVTEYSLDDMDLGAYPSVTPNQPNENLDEIKRGKVSHSSYQLARKYAEMRKKAGKSAFAQMDELRYPQPQD